jgi:hypothetical protein
MIAGDMSSQANTKDERAASLAVIRWRDVGGAPVSSYPLPRSLADAVSRAFAATYPRESFWVEDVPWLASTAPDERGSKHRRVARALPDPGAGRTPSVAP